jgi:hypothetical protein
MLARSTQQRVRTHEQLLSKARQHINAGATPDEFLPVLSIQRCIILIHSCSKGCVLPDVRQVTSRVNLTNC